MAENSIVTKRIDAPPALTDDVKRRHRRGKGSKSKQTDAFRLKKNREQTAERTAFIQEHKIQLGNTPREIFGERLLSAIVSPQYEVPIDLWCIPELCASIVDILHGTCKIPPSMHEVEEHLLAYDSETLMWVTALQIEAKMQIARTGTQYLPGLEPDIGLRVIRTNALLVDTLIPLNVVLDQVGRVTIQEQLFVPAFNGVRDFSYGRLFDETNQARGHFRCFAEFQQPGAITPHRDHLGRTMYARPVGAASHDQMIERGIAHRENDEVQFTLAFLRDPQQFNWMGLVEFVPAVPPPAIPTLEEIVSRYIELRGRICKKLLNVFVESNASKGLGDESQLVYRRRDIADVFTVWSPRQVRSDSLQTGAILALGFENKLSPYNICAVSTTVDVSAGLTCLADTLTKRIR